METSGDQSSTTKTVSNLINLSSTFPERNDTFMEQSNYDINENYNNDSYDDDDDDDDNSSIIKSPIDNQLSDYRIHRHNKYIIEQDINNSLDETKGSTYKDIHVKSVKNDDYHKWPANTLLIASDSIMNNIDEKGYLNK